MAYDETLTRRFKQALGRTDRVTEKRMMGGVCFMLDGHMVGGAHRSSEGEPLLMFRLGVENHEVGAARPGARAMMQGRRRMRGFFLVNADDCSDAHLQDWLELAVGHAESLGSGPSPRKSSDASNEA